MSSTAGEFTVDQFAQVVFAGFEQGAFQIVEVWPTLDGASFNWEIDDGTQLNVRPRTPVQDLCWIAAWGHVDDVLEKSNLVNAILAQNVTEQHSCAVSADETVAIALKLGLRYGRA